jgi:hypothetical protein
MPENRGKKRIFKSRGSRIGEQTQPDCRSPDLRQEIDTLKLCQAPFLAWRLTSIDSSDSSKGKRRGKA